MDNTENVVVENRPVWKRKSRAKPKKNLDLIQEVEEPEVVEEEHLIDNNDSEFLSHLDNTQYTEPIAVVKPPRKSRAKKVVEEVEPTSLYGNEKLTLFNKIDSWKALFPHKLHGFNYSKDLEVEELENVLTEIQCIIEIGNVDAFITESIYACIKMSEGVSSKTPYNITGLSLALKKNPQFNDLLKIMYLRYNTFSNIPAEVQLIMIVSTTALMTIQANKGKTTMSSYLDEPLNI